MSGSAAGRSVRTSAVTRIVVVDDHIVVRRGIVELLENEPGLCVCGDAGTVSEALAVVREQRPHVVLVDLSLGAESGLDLLAALSQANPDTRLLVLSAHDELLFADRAFRAGAHGYVMKSAPAEDLLEAVRRVASGRSYVSADAFERLFATFGGRRANKNSSPFDRLTDRERHVFRLVGQGLETREIAEQLSLSVKTVETHFAHIKEKLGLRSGRDLIRSAVTWVEGGAIPAVGNATPLASDG